MDYFRIATSIALSISCLLYTFVEIVMIKIVNDFNENIYLHSIITVLVAALGWWGSRSKVKSPILFISLSSMLILALMTIMSPGSREEAKNEFLKYLKEEAKHYNWKQATNETNEMSLAVTNMWDSLQTFCCGLNNATTWDDYRPANISSEYFPPSCCMWGIVDDVTGLCKKCEGLITMGCSVLIEHLGKAYQILHYLVIGAFLSKFTFICNCCSCNYGSQGSSSNLEMPQRERDRAWKREIDSRKALMM